MVVKKIRATDKPLYELAKDQLMELLENREVGDRLPSEEVLSRDLGISRNTLREAIKMMAQKGYLEQKQGLGTFVVRKPCQMNSGLEQLESLDQKALRSGWPCTTEKLRIESLGADQELSKRLRVEKGTLLTRVSRVKLLKGKEVAYISDVIPSSVLSLEFIEDNFQGSVLDLILGDQGSNVDYAYTELSATKADQVLSELLEIPEGTPLLLSRETVFGNDGKPLEYALNYLVPDLINFHIIRRINR